MVYTMIFTIFLFCTFHGIYLGVVYTMRPPGNLPDVGIPEHDPHHVVATRNIEL